MKRIQEKDVAPAGGGSSKRNAIVMAGLELFTKYGYRKTSIDDIAEAAQVAKRTVYLNFENKAAVFLAILEYLADQVRQRCAIAEAADGTPIDRLTGLLVAYFGIGFELFGKSAHMPELAETFSNLATSHIRDLKIEYEKLLIRFLRSLERAGEVVGPPQGLSVDKIVYILMRAAEGAKHDPNVQGDQKAFQQRLRELATLVVAAMGK